ncbi:hypothetical protein [Massilia sp. TSP1-1-2]|uniref:hypothetical protein n=1 Tax=Massilia sp. TSP1-1-2 TaxID=2804649 RepID=UPI003CF128E7
MGFAILSLFCSFLMFLTAWLVLPLLVLLPVSIFFGWKGYRETITTYPEAGILVRLLAMAPILVAIATVPLALLFINANYQA